MKSLLVLSCIISILSISTVARAEEQRDYIAIESLSPNKQVEIQARKDSLSLSDAEAGLKPIKDTSIQGVNNFVNSFHYSHDDMDTHWKTPKEFFKDKGGDCKDYAITKYYYLKPEHKVKIAIGYLTHKGKEIPHAVLIVDDKYVLDNRFDKVESIQEMSKTFDVYVYMDANGLFTEQ